MAIKILLLVIELPDGKVVTVEVDSTVTVEKLWQRLEERVRLNPGTAYRLVRESDQLEIPRQTSSGPSSTLDLYDLVHEDRLRLVQRLPNGTSISAATVEKPACEQTEWFDREMKGKQVLPHGQLTSSSSTGEETELLSMPPDNVEANRQDYLDKREMRESGVSTAYSRSSAVLRQRGSTSGLGSSAGKAHVPEFLLVKDCCFVQVKDKEPFTQDVHYKLQRQHGNKQNKWHATLQFPCAEVPFHCIVDQVPISDGILKFLDKEKKRTADVLLITQKGRTFSIFTTRDGRSLMDWLRALKEDGHASSKGFHHKKQKSKKTLNYCMGRARKAMNGVIELWKCLRSYNLTFNDLQGKRLTVIPEETILGQRS
jgi:hypothetical protein